MSFRPPTSRRRFARYREDLRNHNTEGSRNSAAAHRAKRSKEGKRARSALNLFGEFWRFTRPHRTGIFISLGTVVIATGLKLLPPAATGFVLDTLLGDKPVPGWIQSLTETLGFSTNPKTLLALTGVALVIVAIISVTAGMSGRWLNTRNTKQIQSEVRHRVFSHAVRLPLHRIQELKSGGVASVLREDAGGIGELLFSLIYNPFRAIIQLVATFAILAFIDWRLLLGSLLVVPTVYLTHRTWISRIRPLWRDIRAARQDMDGHATESFGGMRVVRSFGRQRAETSRFIRNNHMMIRQELMAWWWSRSVDIAWSVLVPLASAILLWYGGSRIITDAAAVTAGTMAPGDALSVGDLVMFLFYLAMLLEPLAMLASSATSFQNNLAALDRVLDLLDEPVEFEALGRQPGIQPAAAAGHVRLDDVTFTYPGTDTPVLDDISLDIPAGATVAIVGASGAGKSTLVNLVARFFDPTSGRITVDGRDLQEIDVESYRRLLGMVEQDVFLFDGTIGENIAYGRRGASADDVHAAVDRAHVREFVDRLEHGLDTVVGERGVKLSGGQRQRLAIARAILADPVILLLDEATSSLDTETERAIQSSLDELMQGRTCMVIAHRLSTVVGADLIVVLDDGRIVERGTHDELMQLGGRYERMVSLQTMGIEIA
ncbi:MAG: ABC transporter ATP-binding protein [Phycisphaerales bacterium]